MCKHRGARTSPKYKRTRLRSVTDIEGEMPGCATWQSRQFGSSCPPAWECGTTCSRKNRETSAREKATHVARRRLCLTFPDRIVLPVNKKATLPGTVAPNCN